MRMNPVTHSSKSLTDTPFISCDLFLDSPPRSLTVLVGVTSQINLQIQSHLEVLRVRTSTYELCVRRGPVQPITDPQEMPNSKLTKKDSDSTIGKVPGCGSSWLESKATKDNEA